MSFKFFKEPLLHFLLLGAMIFMAYFIFNPGVSDSGNQIYIGQNDIDRFVKIFQKQWQRQPTQEELDGLIRAHVKEEILYREALALDLEKDDTIVRRRLAQKMEFLITDVTLPEEVDDKDLMAFYEKHRQRYSRAAKLSFRHIYFNPDIRGERIMEEARATLDTLKSTNAGVIVPENYGDRFLLPLQYESASEDEIARALGRDFVQQLLKLEPGRWHGPIRSGYGMHLVYIEQRDVAAVYPFNVVRERVKNDYLYELRQQRNDEVLDKLKSRYVITIEGKID